MSVKIFISTVSNEFLPYRERLRHDLTRHNVEVKVQEDFNDLGRGILDELDTYITHCDAVVHFVGDMTGSAPVERDVRALLAKHPHLATDLPPVGNGEGLSYTQWEAWLTLYHKKELYIAAASDNAERGPRYEPTDISRAHQAEHLKRLRAVDRHPSFTFTNPVDLANALKSTGILDWLVNARAEKPARKPRNLPYHSIGPLLKGREPILERLREMLTEGKDGRAIALHGLGGVGKTRLAVEYA